MFGKRSFICNFAPYVKCPLLYVSVQSHQFEEDIVCELSEEMDLEIPTRVLSSSQVECLEELVDTFAYLSHKNRVINGVLN